MQPKSKKINLKFEHIIHQDDWYDPGVQFVAEAMRRAESVIAAEPEDFRDDMTTELLKEFNERWQHRETLVTVTGRIYIEDPGFAGVVPEEWGDAHEDQWGTWFNVQNAQLVSQGVSVWTGNTAVETEEQPDARLGYGFTIPGDDSDDNDCPYFLAFPEEVLTQFEVPSDEAIDFRLHSQLPEIMQAIDAAITPGAANSYRQLVRLTQTLETLDLKDITNDQQEWLALYIFDRIGFDLKWQYIARVQGQILLEDRGHTEPAVIAEPYEFNSLITALTLVRAEGQSHAEPILVLEVPTDRDADDTVRSYVSVPMRSLQGLRTTQPQRSFAELVHSARLEKIRPAIVDAAKLILDNPYDDEELGLEEQYYRSLTAFDRLRRQQEALDDAIALVKRVKENTYDNIEAVTADANAAVGQVNELLAQADLFGAGLRVEGSGAFIPNLVVKQAGETTFEIGLSPESPTLVSVPMFEFNGTLSHVQSSYVSHESDDEEYYTIDVCFVVDDTNSTNVAFRVPPSIALARAQVSRSILVPMTAPASVRVHAFDVAEARHTRLTEFNASRRGQPIAALMKRLDQALHHSASTGYENLRHLDIIQRIGHEIETGSDPDSTMSTLEALFSDKPFVIVGGTIYRESGREVAEIQGRVVGVSKESPFIDEQGAFLVVAMSGEELCYVEMTTIASFRF